MLTHVVMIKLKDRSARGVEDARALLQSLAGAIPSLRSIEVGVDVVRSGRSYDLAVVARFDDLAGLEAYQAHPVHVPVRQRLTEVTESILAVDYLSEGPPA